MNKILAISDLYKNFDQATIVLISISVILFTGFIVSRLTKLCKLPNVTGYIIAGLLIGPHIIGLIPQNIVDGMSFVSDIALAFISFSVGKFFKKSVLKKTGAKVFIITLFESLLAGVLVTFSTKIIFNLDWSFSVMLGAIACATAPASTMMTINQYRAKGDFVETLLQVIALDNVICLFLFNIAATIVNANESGNISALGAILPILYNLLTIAIGFLFGLILGKLLGNRGQNNRLIIIVSMIIGLSAICGMLSISPLLSCMVFGATYINFTKDKEIFKQLSNFTPPIMCIFFVVSGMSLDLKALVSVGLIGFVYVVIRFIGKYLGAYVGSLVAKKQKPIRDYIGLALIPQAGVAIGLAFLAQRILPDAIGNTLLTIILASSVMYELIGPACAKASLFLSGTIKKEDKINENMIDSIANQEINVEDGVIQKIEDEQESNNENKQNNSESQNESEDNMQEKE